MTQYNSGFLNLMSSFEGENGRGGGNYKYLVACHHPIDLFLGHSRLTV